MWIHKNKETIRDERRKKILSPKGPLIISFFGFIIFSAEPPYDHSILWNQFFQGDFSKATMLTILLFSILYAWQLITKKAIGEKTVLICDRCYHTKKYDKKFDCECGGIFLNMYEMKWVEENQELGKDI